jgi:cell wall assembly regulator SMI1
MRDLNEQLRQWCHQHHWYGAELDFGRFAHKADDPRHVRFLARPATAQHVAQAEQLLGFPLPEALTLLYRTLANGGFGPAYGLRSLDPADDHSLICQYQGRSSPGNGTLSELGGQRLWAAPPHLSQQLDLHSTCWPSGLVPICHWGCGAEICLDCAAPHAPVIRVGPAEHDLHLILTGVAPSFDVWLAQWLAEASVS